MKSKELKPLSKATQQVVKGIVQQQKITAGYSQVNTPFNPLGSLPYTIRTSPSPYGLTGANSTTYSFINYQKWFDVVTGKVESVVLANNQLAPPIPQYYHRNYPLASTFNHTSFELDRDKKVWMLAGTEFGSIPFVAVPEDLWGECIAQQVTDKFTT